MKPAIRIEHLSKQYRIGRGAGGSYHTLREAIVESTVRPFRRLKELSRGSRASSAARDDTFWALHDVSFEVERGEVIGVIGRNGAGKSTLLRILSRITEPTSGRVELRGRVASLLEIGTGFHFELTGRENIYLNGAILGMTRREISRRFSAIVAFADIGDFLDTPVKRYSSGMHVRLAFAVACHLEPEILIVDEVLAVGDEPFQKKCLGKLGEVSRSGRTVLFVSHNMAAVANLCQRAAVLDRGRLTYLGSSRAAVDHYLDTQREPGAGEVDLAHHVNRRAGCKPLLRQIRLLDETGRPSAELKCGGQLKVELLVQADQPLANLHFEITIADSTGCRLFTVSTLLSSSGAVTASGSQRVTCHLDQVPLAPGRYSGSVSAGVFRDRPIDAIDQAVWFDVIATDFYGNGRTPSGALGPFVARSQWAVREEAGVTA